MTTRILIITLIATFLGVTLGGPLFAGNTVKVTRVASLGGTEFGLKVNFTGMRNKAFVLDRSPDDESSYNVIFRVDRANAQIPLGKKVTAFKALNKTNKGVLFFDIERKLDGSKKGRVRVSNRRRGSGPSRSI